MTTPIDVRLQDVAEGDLPVLFDQQRDPDANDMAAFPARDREAFEAHWQKILRDDAVKKKTILCDGRVAGYVVSFVQDGEQHVGYWIGREFWGKGVATRALAQFLTHVRARPVFAHVAKHNAASLRVLEKCGFTIVGEVVGSAYNGQPVVDVVLRLPARQVPG